MNSCLYQCEVMHHRLFPRENRFGYRIFMFYVDLDELAILDKKLVWFSLNRFNWFNFRDKDHIQFPRGKQNQKGTKQNILNFLRDQGIEWTVGKVMLLTHVSTLGYSFNPISFYLCFDPSGKPLCAVAEVCNTHGEMKLYVLDKNCLTENTFRLMTPKLFYVSPFANLESSFDFIFDIPGDSLHMRVDDYEDKKRFLLSSLTGTKKILSDSNLLWYGVTFPFLTLRVIGLIYWQALILYWKRVPFHRKSLNPHLQQDAYAYKKV
jgi:uncharacterized protein